MYKLVVLGIHSNGIHLGEHTFEKMYVHFANEK